MQTKNYLVTTGLELLMKPDEFNRLLNSFDIMVVSSISNTKKAVFIQEAQIIELSKIHHINILPEMDILFFNKVILTDLTVRILFDDRISDNYIFEFNKNEINYLRYNNQILTKYQENEDYELGEKFISNSISQMVMYYKLIYDKQIDRYHLHNISTHQQKLAYEFTNAIASFFRTNKTVEFYAEKISVSRRTLSNITKTVFGKTPKQMLENHIIEIAKQQLKKPDRSLKEISADLGFSETNNFLTFFKKMTKLTPTQFRQLYISNIKNNN